MKNDKNAFLGVSEEELSFKEIEELVKTALRNYASLISAADRKAALMIQVNSIIASIVIAFTLRHIDSNPLFVVPVVLMLIVAIATIIFAIMASQPQTKIQRDAGANYREIFFFGSFDRMDDDFMKIKWDDYKAGLQQLVNGGKKEMLHQIAEETFIVRKILAQKFKYIAYSFRVFKYGLTITMLSFIIFYIISG